MENKNITTVKSLIDKEKELYPQMIKDNKLTDILRGIAFLSDQTLENVILLINQKEDVTCVKRFKEWNFYKRRIIKEQNSLKTISGYVEKQNLSEVEEQGKVYVNGVDKLKIEVGHVFDISQTEGKEYEFLNSNKESVAKHFEAVKKALERTARDYKFEYKDIENNVQVDKENKVITIKDGQTINEVINTLVREVGKVLLETRKYTGLSVEDEPEIDEIEKNMVVYTFNKKLGLDLPEYNFDKVATFSDEKIEKFKWNLQRNRSVTKQMLSNVETAIERAVRDNEKKLAEQSEQPTETQPTEQEPQEQVAEVGKVEEKKTTKTRKKKQQESEVE